MLSIFMYYMYMYTVHRMTLTEGIASMSITTQTIALAFILSDMIPAAIPPTGLLWIVYIIHVHV